MRRIIVSLFAFGFFVTAVLQAQTRFEHASVSDQELDVLFRQALLLLPQAKVPLQYRPGVESALRPRCGTVILEQVRLNFERFSSEQQALLRSLFARPRLPLSRASASGRFRFHYADSGNDAIPLDDLDGSGVPDYLEEVEKAFEKSHSVEVDQLGYLRPPDDEGVDGPEYDVYIHNLSGVYGLTTTDGLVPGTSQDDRKTFIEIDNDYQEGYFSEGLAGAQVTAAHEYFHAVQFAYRTVLNNNELFYYELCSVWMEDVVFDEVNDYFQYLRFFFSRPDISFNRFDPFLHYLGEAIWNQFLAKKYDLDLIRRTWEIMQSRVLAIDAVHQALFERGSSLADEFAEFAVWNYFTGSRADTVRFYDEGAAWTDFTQQAKLRGDFTITGDTTIVDSSLALSMHYYRFTNFESGDFLVSGSVDNPAHWKFAAILTPPAGVATYEIFDLARGLRLEFVPEFSEIVVIPVNVRVIDGPDVGKLTTTFSRFTFNLLRVPSEGTVERGITQIYPNPFIIPRHSRTHVDFLPSSSTALEVRILSSSGRVLRTDRFGVSSALSASRFVWDGTDSDNNVVPSGIYLVQLKQDNFTQIKKIAVIRE